MISNASHIRNICIIAHVDHGKSTLADRLIQQCNLVTDREFRDQILDTMDIERERGITIKSNSVTLPYKALDGKDYLINLIDTPGHADFSYEVSRVLASCEGALLLVDAGQGVQAQTVAHLFKAVEHNLEIIPVINKIDLATADIEGTKEQIEEELALPTDDAILCSAKTGKGVEQILEAVIKRIPPPAGDPEAPLKALVFDAIYTPFRGVVVGFRIMEGTIRAGRRHPLHVEQRRLYGDGSGVVADQAGPARVHERRRGRLPGGRHPDAGGRADRRYDDARPEPDRAKPARFRAGQADGLLLDLPDVRQRLRRAGGGDRALRAQRRGAGLSEGLVGRPRPGLPLRVPRRAAPRRRAAAHRGGARHLARPDRAERGVSRPAVERRSRRGGQPFVLSRPGQDRERGRAVRPGVHHHAGAVHRAR